MTEPQGTRHEPLAGARVLVVEDELLISILIEEVLLDEKCVLVGPFATVTDGLKAAQTEAIDFALLDVNIAGIKVYPVADALATRDIPFLFLSGYGAQALPANRPDWQVVSKPFTGKELVAILTRHWT